MLKVRDVVDEKKIFEILKKTQSPNREEILDVLQRAEKKQGLGLSDAGILINVKEGDLVERIFKVAGRIKREIYGDRLVLFAPLYVSSYCVNDCEYCSFHRSNTTERKKLSIKEIKEQVKILEDMGHKRLLLEFGEHPKRNPIDYVVSVIDAIYATKSGKGEIRRVNVNIAGTTVENYRKLKNAGIGTYQLFQETYHRETYGKMHSGPKADYKRQLFSHDRAFEAGIDDVGLGVLFGLFNWRFEVLALLSHAKYLDKKFGVGPHTISVPRWQPAKTVDWKKSPALVSENDLLKIIAILRMAVPYTGMIISTRERAEVRARAFEIGISQTSAASVASPGGYGKEGELSQFSLQDHRSVNGVISGILKQGLLPSFCTACYRKGRTGETFMDWAKPGNIQNLCHPNAILTFREYLEDYATEEVKILGLKIINKYIEKIPDKKISNLTKKRLIDIEDGKRDLYF